MRGINLVIGLLLAASPAAADKVSVKQLAKGGTYDCGKDPHVSIGNGGGTYTFKGECQTISVGGGKNKLTVESVRTLMVGGAMNTIDVDAVSTIDVGGAMNKITWKKVKGGGDKPALRGQPDKNTITQSN